MKMHVFTIEISRDAMDKVRDAFYKKDGLEKLVSITTEKGGNAEAMNIIADKYTSAYATWQVEMSTIEQAALKHLCRTFQYNYSMDFLKSQMTLETYDADPSLSKKLQTIGFKEAGNIEVPDILNPIY